MNLYESINKGFEAKYGKVEEAQISKQAPKSKEVARKARLVREAREDHFPIKKYLADNKDAVDQIVSSAQTRGWRAANQALIDFIKEAPEIPEGQKKAFEAKMSAIRNATGFFSAVATYMTAIKVDAGAKAVHESLRSRKAMKEARDPLAGIKRVDISKYKRIRRNAYDNVDTYEVTDDSLGEGVNQFDVWYATVIYDEEEGEWCVMSDQAQGDPGKTIAQAIKNAYDDFKDWDEYGDATVLGWAIDDHEVDYNAPASEDSEFDFYLIDLIHDYNEDEEDDEDEDFDESFKSASKHHNLKESKKLVSRKAVKESLRSRKASMKLTEALAKKKALKECDCPDCQCDGACTCTKDHDCCGGEVKSRRAMKRHAMEENLGQDIDQYQKWVDYDMKKYGKISDITNNELKKAGLKVVKDKYGDYEVMA